MTAKDFFLFCERLQNQQRHDRQWSGSRVGKFTFQGLEGEIYFSGLVSRIARLDFPNAIVMAKQKQCYGPDFQHSFVYNWETGKIKARELVYLRLYA